MKLYTFLKSYLKSKPIIKFLKIFFSEIVPGYHIYKHIEAMVDTDTKLIICSPRGTGDIYMIGRYFRYYISKNNIKKYEFIFRGKSERNIGKLFGIYGNIILNDHEVWLLNRFKQFVGENNTQILELHHYAYPVQAHASSIYFEGYKGWTFERLIRNVGMGIKEDVAPYVPRFQTVDSIKNVFYKKGLIPGRTIIISPFSSSAYILDFIWWTRLVERLTKLGYTIATNVSSDSDYEIVGTKRLFIPYEEIKSYVEYAGYFIGARSGLCDIIGDCDCYKIILTPYWDKNLPWQGCPGKTLDFYGFQKNYNNKSILEIEYDLNTKNDVLYSIVDILDNETFKTGTISFSREVEIIPRYNNKFAIVYYVTIDNYIKTIISITSVLSNIENEIDIIIFSKGLDEEKNKCFYKMHDSIRVTSVDSIIENAIHGIDCNYDERNVLIAILPYILKRFINIIYISENMIVNKNIISLLEIYSDAATLRMSDDISYRAYMNSKYKKIDNAEGVKIVLLKKNQYPNIDFIQINVKNYLKNMDQRSLVKKLIKNYKNDLTAFYLGEFADEIYYLPQKYNFMPSDTEADEFFCKYVKDYELYEDYIEACKEPVSINYRNLNHILSSPPSIWSSIFWKYARQSSFYEYIYKNIK